MEHVLDIIEWRSGDHSQQPGNAIEPKFDTSAALLQRKWIINELIETERTFVHHLTLLLAFKERTEAIHLIDDEIFDSTFWDLRKIVNFQRNFLTQIENMNAQSLGDQDWGKVFERYGDAVEMYVDYVSNLLRSETFTRSFYMTLEMTGGPPEIRQFTQNETRLMFFLSKPYQRLLRYIVLLKVNRNVRN